MANIYKACRKQEASVTKALRESFRRAQRSKLHQDRLDLDPSQRLNLMGFRSVIHRDDVQYENQESMASLMPWNNNSDTMIDRFDCRSSLDVIQDTPAGTRRLITEQDEEIEEQCDFQRYRDIVIAAASSRDEYDVIQEADSLKMRLAERQAASKDTAVAAAGDAAVEQLPPDDVLQRADAIAKQVFGIDRFSQRIHRDVRDLHRRRDAKIADLDRQERALDQSRGSRRGGRRRDWSRGDDGLGRREFLGDDEYIDNEGSEKEGGDARDSPTYSSDDALAAKPTGAEAESAEAIVRRRLTAAAAAAVAVDDPPADASASASVADIAPKPSMAERLAALRALKEKKAAVALPRSDAASVRDHRNRDGDRRASLDRDRYRGRGDDRDRDRVDDCDRYRDRGDDRDRDRDRGWKRRRSRSPRRHDDGRRRSYDDHRRSSQQRRRY